MATSNIAYQINYSNQGRTGHAGSVDNFFSIAPLRTNVDQPTLFDAAGNQIAPTPLSLVFTGYRNPEYGQALWTNMLQLLENFASPTKPTNPVLGQLWFNKSSELGALCVCTDPINSAWMSVNSRIFVSSVPPVVSGPTLWYNPDNSGLFFWDSTLSTTRTTANPPFTTIDPTGPVDAAGHPTIHSQVGLAIGSKWVNVLYHRYAAVTEYNSLVTQFAAWDMANRPEALPVDRQPTDSEWLALFAYVEQYGDALIPAVDTSALVPTVFKYYSTDRFGFVLLQQYYDTLLRVCAAIFTQLSINQTPVPIVGFTASSTVGIVPMVVTFVDNSAHTGGATYLWNFGDGVTKTTVGTTTHTYQSPGSFTASLLVTSIAGSSTASQLIQAVAAPIASFTLQYLNGTTAPATVVFTDTSINLPTSWLWNFGDGTTSTAQNPSHVFNAPGTYITTLVATNAAGSRSTSQSVATDTPIVVTSFIVSSLTVPISTSVEFTDTSINSPISWLWNFGDGTTSTAQNPTHAYTTLGTYTVTLTTTNAAGSNTFSLIITATAIAPVASFTRTPLSGTAPLSVAFTDTSINLPTSWFWNFGDGTTSTAQNPTHVFNAPGAYIVTLVAVNTTGTSTTTESVIAIAAVPAVVPNFTLQYLNDTTAPASVAFTDTSTNSPTSWFWNFGDGATSVEQNPTHLYTAPGTYTVELTAINATGGNTIYAPVVLAQSRGSVTMTVNTSIQDFTLVENVLASQYGTALTVAGTGYIPGQTDFTVVVNAVIGSTSRWTAAFRVGAGLAAGDTVKLQVESNGYVVGAGGQAGGHGTSGMHGFPGGDAIDINMPITIINNGTIGGGGGGGGKGSTGDFTNTSGPTDGSGGGGGGAGYLPGPGGRGANLSPLRDILGVDEDGDPIYSPYYGGPGTTLYGHDGVGGTLTSGGAGGAGSSLSGYGADRYGTSGGAGGSLGAAGSEGARGGAAQSPGAGGAPGAAVRRNGHNVAWGTTGAVLGAIL